MSNLNRELFAARLTKGLGLVVSIAVTFLGLLAVTFFIGRVIPIDPVLTVVGDRASTAAYNQAKEAMGLNQPIYIQFGLYVGQILRGDFGVSVLTSNPVLTDIQRVFPATFELATMALLIGILLGVPSGVYAAVRRGRLGDHVVRALGLVGYSVPVFWLGLMGLLIFYAKFGWVAGPGRLDVLFEGLVPSVTGVILIDSVLAGQWDVFQDAFAHVILPACILGYFSMAYISRMTRSFMIDQLEQEYVTTARVKGLSKSRIVWNHALRNAVVPLITVISLSYGGLLEGSVLTEMVFSWPGLGFYITNSLLNGDMNAVLGGTIVVGAIFVVLNLLTDFLYKKSDPRTR